MARPIVDNQGFVALAGVLITGAIAAAVASSVLLSGSDFSILTLSTQRSYQARALAKACAESALMVIHDNIAFSGTGGLTLGQGSCDYTVTNTGGETRLIQTEATVGTVVKRLEVTIDGLNPGISVLSWREVGEF